jgi:hypothetical protein
MFKKMQGREIALPQHQGRLGMEPMPRRSGREKWRASNGDCAGRAKEKAWCVLEFLGRGRVVGDTE